MLLFDMKADPSAEAVEKLLRKMSWMSSVLGEVDDWVESGRAAGNRPTDGAPARHKQVRLETLDLHLAREGR